jgi:hypothetical protein
MSTSSSYSNKDHIETVIFTPTTGYHCEKPDCVQERVVSYEDMDELNAKLYNLYSSNNGMFPMTTRRLDECSPHKKELQQNYSNVHRRYSSNREEEGYGDEDDFHLEEEADFPYKLHPSSSSRRHHVIEPIPIPPPTPSPVAYIIKAPKDKNRLRRFYSKGWGRHRID